MSKEDFLEILSRQQRSGLMIKDFCINETYTESNFYYWKEKFDLPQPYYAEKVLFRRVRSCQIDLPAHCHPVLW